MRWLLFVLLFGCTTINDPEPMKASSLFATFSSSVPWYLSGGIPTSQNYTVYDPYSASSLADSYINLANPGTRNAAPGVAPTLSSGWQFNGTSTYLDTGVQVDANTTCVVIFEGAAVTNAALFGIYQASPTRFFTAYGKSSNSSGFNYGPSQVTNPTRSTTIGGAIALSANGFYQGNGRKIATPSTWSGAITSRTGGVTIGAENQGSKVGFFAGRILRIAFYDFTLTDSQVEAVMSAGLSIGIDSTTSYLNTVLASGPVFYFPCNTKTGFSYLKNYTSNKSFATLQDPNLNNYTCGASGKYGVAVQANGDVSATALMRPSTEVAGLLDPDEFSFACWIYVTSTPAKQVRTSNLYSSNLAEYAVTEIRNGTEYKIFMREGGVDQNSATLAAATDNTWQHFVFYNSKSQGVLGIYLDGTKYEIAKTTSGFSDTVVGNYFPEIMNQLAGRFQHISYYDHALTQSEVNALQ